jgi:oligopeptide/dipeptide ABC transporter ATP-binding protein
VAFADSDGALVRAADRVSFELRAGEVLGIVGESGCGKSVTLRSLIGLQQPGAILGGSVVLDGRDLVQMSDKEMRRVRGASVGMIFQHAGAALNPVLSVGTQLVEVLRAKAGMGRAAAKKEAISLLERVGIPAASQRVHDYPHQLSGGMQQRVMIALALAPRPALMLADEPTTALDVTVQDQVLNLLAELRRENDLAMILVSHDLNVIAQECDRIAVMYAGRVVEYGSANAVLDHPRHPCTMALMESSLSVQTGGPREALSAAGGQPPSLAHLPSGCSFRDACRYADELCGTASMELDREPPEHGSACIEPERMQS